MSNIILLLVYLAFSAMGLILFKIGVNDKLSISFIKGSLDLKISYLTIIGIVCYMISFILYLGLISKLKLSYIVPLTTGIMQIIILLATVFIFKETVTVIQVVGIVVVVIGIYMINL